MRAEDFYSRGWRVSRPRIRSIRPDLWQDRDFQALSPLGRLSFLALISHADDEGRLATDSGHIATAYVIGCLPDEIAGQVGRMEDRRMVVAYERRGVRYIAIHDYTGDRPWSQRIDHPTTSELPKPPKFHRRDTPNKGQLELDSLASPREHSRRNGRERTGQDRKGQDGSGDSSLARSYESAGLCEQLKATLDEWGAKGDVTERWRVAEDRLLRLDKRPADEARIVLDWATHDDFWRPNILSLPTFRDHYDQVKGQMMRATAPRPGKPGDPLSLRRRAAELAEVGD